MTSRPSQDHARCSAPTDRADVIGSVATSLLSAVDATGGVRLLGVGVAGLTDVLQEDLFAAETPLAQPPKM